MAKADLTRERVLEYVDVSSEPPVWIKRSGRLMPGSEFGTVNERGARQVTILGNRLLYHRLVWFLEKGVWPEGEIDHRDNYPSNNKIENLRDATKTINTQNIRRAQKNNKTGFLGVTKNRKAFVATIGVESGTKYLGSFTTPEEAHEAYVKAKRELHQGNTL